MKNPWLIFGGIIVVLFAGAFYLASTASESNNEGIKDVTHIKGNPDADVELVEYSDFQCPACSAMYPVVKELMVEHGDKIRFEYRHFPIERIHPYAVQAAVAAEAAGQQGKFYEFHDLLFENQQTWCQTERFSQAPPVLLV
jgi:protein-disulfide isomerase